MFIHILPHNLVGSVMKFLPSTGRQALVDDEHPRANDDDDDDDVGGLAI